MGLPRALRQLAAPAGTHLPITRISLQTSISPMPPPAITAADACCANVWQWGLRHSRLFKHRHFFYHNEVEQYVAEAMRVRQARHRTQKEYLLSTLDFAYRTALMLKGNRSRPLSSPQVDLCAAC